VFTFLSNRQLIDYINLTYLFENIVNNSIFLVWAYFLHNVNYWAEVLAILLTWERGRNNLPNYAPTLGSYFVHIYYTNYAKGPVMKIGFVSTRFSGIDGVTLEARKWAEVLEEDGHHCFWLAGELSNGEQKGILAPVAHFHDSLNQWINSQIFGRKKSSPKVICEIHKQKAVLKTCIEKFVKFFEIDLLLVQNALSIPMNVPLGVALMEFIEETGIPTIAHHHDFCWERSRFLKNGVKKLINSAFPPNLPSISHIVINSDAQLELMQRKSIVSTYIPNVLNFEKQPRIDKARCQAFRETLGLTSKDILFLQPTRIIERKGIKHAIELVKAIDPLRCKLVISHSAGDEGLEHLNWLKKYATSLNVKLILANNIVSDTLSEIDGNRMFSLREAYQAADFVTFPSIYEGFGNALLEAIYFKKPVMINRYKIYVQDIAPKGFNLVEMNGRITKTVVQNVKQLLGDSVRRKRITNYNYDVARKNYSYKILRKKLLRILSHSPVCARG